MSLSISQLTNSEIEELKLIGLYQPVFSGDVLSKQTCKSLIDKKIVLKYENDYCLTELGKKLFISSFPTLKIGKLKSKSYL